MNAPVSAPRVIAIDGPAASGKSSVARELAKQLGFAYVNSGAMYRAFTWHVLQSEVDPADRAGVARLADSAAIVCHISDEHESKIQIDGVDPSGHLRDDRVNDWVSPVSSVPRVREVLVERMHAFARDRDVVVEGRDIGSVVFPETKYKFYIDASHEVRSRRRAAQGGRDAIATRDHADSSRSSSPLIVADDAHVIDSSELSIEAVVAKIFAELKLAGFK